MKQSLSKSVLMSALITGCVSYGYVANAAENMQEFILDPMIVTAQRMEKEDLDTPATVEVIDSEKIERSGAGSAFEILRNSLGITSSNQAPNGIALGSMTSEINIRGVDKGTLVLVDGIPINQDGKYNLEDIPADMIEKIEIVRGGGSVLYGSEATGGVVNIITKNTVRNSIKVAAGNFGRERYTVNLGADKFNATAHLENRGKISPMTTIVNKKASQQYYDYVKGESKGILWNYNINDNLKFTHNYIESDNRVDIQDSTYLKSPYQIKEYEDNNNSFLLTYDDKNGLTSHISYGTQERNYDQSSFDKNTGSLKDKIKYSWRKGHNTNIDIQKVFNVNEKDKFLIGASFKKEDMDVYNAPSKKMGSRPAKPASEGNYLRDVYSLYASYDWKMNDTDNLIVNMRETFVKNCDGDVKNLEDGSVSKSEQKDLSKFTPEVQYIKRLTEDSSFYAKAGKSFRLPELTKLFGGSVMLPSIDLKPEQGTHYEIGYKLNENNRAWRLAIFNYKIKDSIEIASGSAATGDVVYDNTDVKNTGIELSCNIQHNDNFESYWGITYSNPKAKSFSSDGKNGEWTKYDNQLQFNMGVGYHKDKIDASLTANYIGLRSDKTTDGRSRLTPALYTDLHFGYTPEKNQKLFLHINNLFDRKDFTTASGPDEDTYGYYSVGRNFMLGYEVMF